MAQLAIDADITRAQTLPSSFYRDEAMLQRCGDRLFARCWHLAADIDNVRTPQSVHPFTLYPGFIDDPLVLTRDSSDQLHCVSNVCTHRGMQVALEPNRASHLRCSYHGRRFALDGLFESMPEFEQTKEFPRPCDNLAKIPFAVWKRFIFVSFNPAMSCEQWLAEMDARIGWLPVEQARLDATRSRDYMVQANWALYCDNYLEGFHIPFVHSALAATLDYGQYRTERFRYGNVQVGVSRGGEHTFKLPKSSPDFGKDVAGYYFWLLPNIMFNFYPWGISINIVRPLAVNRTKVSYLTYIWDESKLDKGAGASLDRVEREDEFVVEAVQKGIQSRFYDRGRYSPTREQGVHHFHTLLAEFLDEAAVS